MGDRAFENNKTIGVGDRGEMVASIRAFEHGLEAPWV
jgi:hypothetical protein